MANSNDIGRAGEFLVAAELEQRGIRCHRVDLKGDDLWVKSALGKLLTMQVKTTMKPSQDRGRPLCYAFTRVSGNAQIFAYVALDLRLFILRNPPTGKTVRIKPFRFTQDAMESSINRFIF